MESKTQICNEKVSKDKDSILKIREENLKLFSELPEIPKNLNSNMKAVQKFIAKLKNLTNEQPDLLKSEYDQLKLQSYILEIVEILTDVSKIQNKDISIIIDLCEMFHKRYEGFAVTYLASITKVLKNIGNSIDEASQINQKRIIFKIIPELFLRGLIQNILEVGKLISELMNVQTKEEKIINMNVLSSMLKSYAEVLFGMVPKSIKNQGPEIFGYLKPNQKAKMIEGFKKYYKGCCDLIADEEKLLNQQKKILDESRKEIDIDKEVEKKYIQMKQTYETMWKNVIIFAGIFDFDLPSKFEEKSGILMQEARQPEKAFSESDLFEDEFQRQLYLEFPQEKLKENENSKNKFKSEIQIIINKLSEMNTIEQVDYLFYEFGKVNQKYTRKKLTKAIININRTSLFLIPFYSRLVALLSRQYKDIGDIVIESLMKELNELFESKDTVKIETKIKDSRFLGELHKFKICNEDKLFDLCKYCIENLYGHNIEIICNLLETCGYYLSKSPKTKLRLNNTVDILYKVSKTKNLGSHEESSIEYIYNLCKNPDRFVHSKIKNKSDIHCLIKYLINVKLNSSNFAEITDFILELPLSKQENLSYLIKQFLKQTRSGKYNDMQIICAVLRSMINQKQEFIPNLIIEGFLDQFYFGLEKNDYRECQQRIMNIKFFGEFYRFEVIKSDLIFDILYILINQNPQKSFEDDNNDSFRVHLICTLLEACGEYFSKGARKDKLDQFLLLFCKYYFLKVL